MNAELIETRLRLAQAHAQMAQLNMALSDYQFREASADAQRLATELRVLREAEALEATQTAPNAAGTPLRSKDHA